jgi:hypothetical protein
MHCITHARLLIVVTVVLGGSLTACRHRDTSNLDDRDAGIDAEASPSVFDTADMFDAATCDPLGLNESLESTPDNIARALDPKCFHSGAGRRALVIEALCTHDKACSIHHSKDCRSEYEAQWQERLHPNGLSVPCADALLDAMSCRAEASCEDARYCASATKRAEIKCDPSAPILGAPMCPPLPLDRELTKGPIPEDAINDAGIIDETRVPDFIPALDPQGEIAGYVRYCALHAGGAVDVYADDLKTVVGHMVPGKGFVPGALP